MFISKFIKDRARALKIADNLSLANFLMVGLLCFTTYQAVNNKSIITIVPPYLDERVKLSFDAASEAYHVKYALFAAVTLGNVTPASVNTTIKALEMTFSPSLYHSIKATLQKQGDVLKRGSSVLEFVPKTWEYEAKIGITYITGIQVVRPLSGTATKKLITYEFSIEVRNYVPWIKHFALYNGVAHNKLWRDENSES